MNKLVMILFIALYCGVNSSVVMCQQSGTEGKAAATSTVDAPPVTSGQHGLPVTTDPQGPKFATVPEINFPALIQIEDDDTFNNRLMIMSNAYNGLDTELLTNERFIYWDKVKKARDEYNQCLTEQNTRIKGDKNAEAVMLKYALCESVKDGDKSCDRLKDISKDLYEQCLTEVKINVIIWRFAVKPLMSSSTKKEDLRKLSEQWCDHIFTYAGDNIPEELRKDKDKFLDTCVEPTNEFLEALRVVIFLRDRRECNSIPDSNQFKDYCFANFDKEMDFCQTVGLQSVAEFFCTPNIFTSIMAISLQDTTLLPESVNGTLLEAAIARSFIAGNSCDDYYKENMKDQFCSSELQNKLDKALSEVVITINAQGGDAVKGTEGDVKEPANESKTEP